MIEQEALEIIREEYDLDSIEDYLMMLAQDNGLSYNTVYALYSIYGDNELFDGLVTAVEDAGCA